MKMAMVDASWYSQLAARRTAVGTCLPSHAVIRMNVPDANRTTFGRSAP
jgi:hypothetical protein